MKIRPSNAGTWNNKGVVLKNLGKYNEAIQSYDKVLEIDPNYADYKLKAVNNFYSYSIHTRACFEILFVHEKIIYSNETRPVH